MNDKLSLQDLADILSQQAQIDKKDADIFFKEFFQLILERIYENDSVKIKDFGTFKLTAINSRESIDVNTGEKIEIPAHFRFTFLPDKTLKELVNKPFSKYQTVLLEEGMDLSNINFESSNDSEDSNEDGIDDNEVSKIIQEQAKLIEEIQIKDQVKPKSITEPSLSKNFSKIDLIGESKKKSEKETVTSRPSSKPFVYTYSTTKSSENKEKDVIMMTVRKDRISKIGVDKPLLNDKNNNLSDTLQSRKQDVKKLDVIPVERNSQITKTAVPNSERVRPASIKDLDDDLIDINNTFNLSNKNIDKKDDDSNIPSIISSISNSIAQKIKKNDSNTQENKESVERKTDTVVPKEYFNNSFKDKNDPNRPLIPEDATDEDTLMSVANLEKEQISGELDQIDIDTAFTELGDRGVEMEDDRVLDTPPPVQATPVSPNVETQTQEEMINPFFDYESKVKKQSKLKTIIPIVLLILILLVVFGYNVYKLFNVKDDFERYHNVSSENLTMVDSFPSLYEENVSNQLVISDTAKIGSYADTLSEENTVVVDTPALKTDVTSTSNAQNTTIEEPTTEQSAVIDADASRNHHDTDLKKNSRKISNNLSISIANKGALFVQKQQDRGSISDLIEDQVNNIKTTPVENTDRKYDTTVRLKSGMTLRSLATKYYGNGDYWVYIYTANKNKLPNPNSITIGISLVIPTLKEFGISNPKDPTQLDKAKRLEYEILR